MNKWFQEGSPSSYKIQILYVDIPKHLQLKKKPVDTPFRFRNYEEANNMASDLFQGYEYRIVGSNDDPHWNIPEAQMTGRDLKQDKWHDVYGVTPAYRVEYQRKRDADLEAEAISNKTYQELQKLRPAPSVAKKTEK